METSPTCFCTGLQKASIADEINRLATLCSTNCKFCRFKRSTKYSDIYRIIKCLHYNDIKSIIGIDAIVSDEKILEDIVKTKGGHIGFDDLNIIFDQKTLTNIETSVVEKICGVVEKNLIRQQSVYYSHGDCMAIKLLRKMINNDSLLANQYRTIMGFVLDMLKKGLIKKIGDLGVQIADFSMLMELALEEKITDETNFEPIMQIINEGSFFRVGKNKFEKFWALPSYVFDAIGNKLDNIIDFISYIASFHMGTEIEINVNPKNIATSLKLEENVLETEIFLDNLSCRNKSFISYLVTDKVSMGYDAGGLTKDFYSLISSEILKNCEDVDGFMYPKRDSGLHQNIWKFYGIMICRSVFLEKLSMGINFHPILCYFFLHGIKNTKIRLFFNQLSLFDIDYIANTKKVLEMSDVEYAEFMELQCEDLIPKASYIGIRIYEKYLHPEISYIVEGFKLALSRYSYSSYLTLVTLYRYVNGNWKYDIIGDSVHSLKKNLTIKMYKLDKATADNASHARTEARKVEYFKEEFLKVLEHYNQTDTDLLKKFMKFWLGTSSISTFDGLGCKVMIEKKDTFGCFESHTCFNQLDIESKNVSLSADYGETLKRVIDKSLKNQELCESAGYRMQFM